MVVDKADNTFQLDHSLETFMKTFFFMYIEVTIILNLKQNAIKCKGFP